MRRDLCEMKGGYYIFKTKYGETWTKTGEEKIKEEYIAGLRIRNVFLGSGSGSGIIIPDPDPTNIKTNF